MKGLVRGIILVAFTASCLGDPVGSGGELRLAVLNLPKDSLFTGAPGQPLPTAVSIRVTDEAGRAIGGASARWNVSGRNAVVQTGKATSGYDGTLSASWVFGTDATEQQVLTVEVAAGHHSSSLVLHGIAVPTTVAALQFIAETTTSSFGIPVSLEVQATDPYGNRFRPPDLRFQSLDSALVTVDTSGIALGTRRGFARVLARAGAHADTAWVHCTQSVQSLTIERDTIGFQSIGQVRTLAMAMTDDHGFPVADSLPTIEVADTSIVAVQIGNPLLLKSLANGVSALRVRAGVVGQAVAVRVAQRATRVNLTPGSLAFDAVTDTARIKAALYDSLGVPLAMPHPVFASGDPGVAAIDSAGLVTSHANGRTQVIVRALSGVADTVAVVVQQAVARVLPLRDSVAFDALHAVQSITAEAVDRLGSPVPGITPTYTVGDSTVAVMPAAGVVRAVGNGTTRITATAAGQSAVVAVRVAQRPVRVVVPNDTLVFDALGQKQQVLAGAIDSLGSPVNGSVKGLAIADTTIARALDSATARSTSNGVTNMTFTVAGLQGSAVLAVKQVAESLSVAINGTGGILSLPLDSLVPVSCRAFDRNGFGMAGVPSVAPSSGGRWMGTRCDSVRIQRSGFDTLRFSLQRASATLPLVLAVRPIVTIAQPLRVDSLPSGTGPWAPTLHRNASGELELFFAAYGIVSNPDSQGPGDLHRLISEDGVTFRYDRPVLQHDTTAVCNLTGSGIENVEIVPRAEASGWRILYSGGSFPCYGWQVFSAVSSDGVTWTPEPGIRVSNGGAPPPAAPNTPPWPAGEGLVVDQMSTGDWRMLAGTYEHITPTEEKFQITEWRSSDQLSWSYLGPVLTTRDLPPEGQRSVYSPTVSSVAPGLWRMFFTADNLDAPNGHSRLWSAVSTDHEHWQPEGVVLEDPTADYFYSTIVGNLLITVRGSTLSSRQLYAATVTMP